MKILKYALILFIGLLSFSCSEDFVSPNTEDEDDPIIIGHPDDPKTDSSTTVQSDSTMTI